MIQTMTRCDDEMLMELRVMGPSNLIAYDNVSSHERVRICLVVHADGGFTIDVAVSEEALWLYNLACDEETNLDLEGMKLRERMFHKVLMNYPLTVMEQWQIVLQMLDFLDEHLGAGFSEEPGQVTHSFLPFHC